MLSEYSISRGRIALILVGILVLFQLVIAPNVAWAADVEISGSPSVTVAKKGEEYTIDLVVSSDVALREVMLQTMVVDPSIFRSSVEEGPFFKEWAQANGATTKFNAANEKNGGLWRIEAGLEGGDPNKGPSGKGVFARLQIAPIDRGVRTLDFQGDYTVVEASKGMRIRPRVKVPEIRVPEGKMGFEPKSKRVNKGESFTVDVNVDVDAIIRGVQFGLNFDPSLLQVGKVEMGRSFKEWEAANSGSQSIVIPPFKIDNSGGKVSVGAVALMGGPPEGGLKGSAVVATVSLTAKADGTAKLALTEPFGTKAAGGLCAFDLETGEILIGAQAVSRPASSPTVPAPTPVPTATRATQPTPAAPAAPVAPQQTPGTKTAPTPGRAAAQPTAQKQAATAQQAGQPQDATQGQASGGVPAQPAPAQGQVNVGQPVQGQQPAPQVPQAGVRQIQPIPGQMSVVVPPAAPPKTAAQVAKPKGSAGLFIPWEVVAGVGGGILSASIVLFASRRRESRVR